MKVYKVENNGISEINKDSIVLDEKNYYWVLANTDEVEEIKDVFDFKVETIEECKDCHHDAKIEVYPKYNFCIFNHVNIENKLIHIDALNVYYSKNYIVCVNRKPITAVDTLINKIKEKDSNLLLNAKNPCNKILYLLLDDLFIGYFNSIIEFEKKIEVFEEHVLKNRFKTFIGEFIAIRRQVLRIVRDISPLAYLIDIIKLNENKSIEDEMMRYFENLEIKFDKLNSSISGLKESVAYLREAYESEVSNQSNNIMMIFTIVSSVFLPLTLITGIFGMNFINIPWLNNPYGFYGCISAMILVGIGLLAVFKTKKWI